jgi:hypothetical protein
MKRFITFLDNKERMNTYNVSFIFKILVSKKITVYTNNQFLSKDFPINQYNINTLNELGIKRQTIGDQV